MTRHSETPRLSSRWRQVAQRLHQAREQLVLAESAVDGADVLRHAHLSALRSAHAIVLALGGQPKRGRPRSTWAQLDAVTDELAVERNYFEQAARYRDLWESGVMDIDPERMQQHKDMAHQFLEGAAALVRALLDAETHVDYDLAS